MLDYNLVDIHFHTSDSFDAYENNGKIKFDIDTLIKAEKQSQNPIKLIVKTDHNIFNFTNYLAIKEKLKDINVLFLPGIEINGDNKVHWIFIFNDEQLDEITSDGKKYGEVLDNIIIKFFKYAKGYTLLESKVFQNTPVSIYDFIKELSNEKIEYLAVPHLDKSSGGAYEKIKKDSEYFKFISNMMFDNIINGFESKKQNEFFDSLIKTTEENIVQAESNIESLDSDGIERRKVHLAKLKKLYNCTKSGDISIIYGSDFHGDNDFNFYESKKDNLFYMKSSLTFNGLKFALLDSDSRIFSKVNYDKYRKTDDYVISKVVLSIDNNEVPLEFGDGLNSIIGSRGSGKSFLLSLICDTVDKTKTANAKHISNQVSLKCIEYKSGKNEQFLNKNSYEYISQKNSTFNKGNNNNNIYEMLAEAPYDVKKFKSNIIQLSGSNTTENLEIDQFFKELNILVGNWYKLSEIKKDSKNYGFLSKYNDEANTMTENLKIRNIFSNLNSTLEKSMTTKEKDIELIDSTENTSNDIIKNLSQIIGLKEYKGNESKYKFDEILKVLNDKYFENLKEIKSKIEINKKTIFIVKERNKNIVNVINSNLKNIEQSYSNDFNELQQHIENVVSILRSAKIQFEKIKVVVENEIKNKQDINYKTSDQSYNFMTEKTFNIHSLEQKELDQILKNYNGHFNKDSFINLFTLDFSETLYEKEYYPNISGKTKSFSLELPELEESVLLLNNQNEYDNLNNMSPGERADILMNIILKDNSNKILIIDQPEDDLDNETIQQKIVNKIRDLKLKRQVVVVTHNANICINGDSDNIVVCQNDNGTYKYFSDHLETKETYDYNSINSNVKNGTFLNVICQILDGGKKALKKRVRKIGYQSLFFEEEKDDRS